MSFFNILKLLSSVTKRLFNNSSNWILFKLFKVDIGEDWKIKGKLNISNNGQIIIGENFKANSGKKYNRIGGDIILRFICMENAIISIGDNCGISNSTFVAKERISIGDHVMIGGGCKLWDNDFHSIDPEIRTSKNDNNVKTAPIVVKDYAFIGGGSTVLKGVEIERNSIVAAGSVVTKSIPENEVWGGNPARFIKKIDPI